MRKNLIFSLILTVCVIVLSFACVKPAAHEANSQKTVNNGVVTVAKSEKEDKVLETRFLNMLNRNFVYNDDFYNDAALVDNSVLALLDLAQDGYVDETYVKDYIFNMYGKIYDDFSFLGENEKEGYVYIVPRGYSIYTHQIQTVTANEDGSFTVVSLVEVSYEDGSLETLTCETLFLANEESAFGYNIMYSEILETVSNGIDC